MGRSGFAVGLLLALGLVTMANCAPEATVTASQAQIPPLAPGMARVWFLRGWDAPSGQNPDSPDDTVFCGAMILNTV
jgi:hypothetical protein